MKTNKFLAIAMGALLAVSCSDFEEMNKNPKAINSADAEPYWALNKSIIADQQNPNDAERVFVLYWADIARQDGESGSGRTIGRSNDEWVGCLYSLTNNCITSANNAITLSEEKLATDGLSDRNQKFYTNIKSFARIWRVYLMTEFVDSFGSYTTDFTSISPVYQSVEECYNFMFDELEEAVKDIDTATNADTDIEKQGDPSYANDPVKWKNFGVSMWMRIAMRLSNVNGGAKAKEEFAAAVAAGGGLATAGITTNDGNFRVKERSGWDDLSGVMSRTWDWQETSMTMANLMTNLGGARAEDILLDPGQRFYASQTAENVAATYGPYIKDAGTYLGVAMKAKDKDGIVTPLYEANTDCPTVGYFFDGIPSYIDPRAFVYFCLPGDYDNRIETGYCTFMRVSSPKDLIKPMTVEEGAQDTVKIDTRFAFNGIIAGFGKDDKYMKFGPMNNGSSYGPTYPSLQERYRNNTEYRIFFGAWETAFLKAEAIVKNYVSGDDKGFYEDGIKASMEYLSVDANYNAYIASENYNRVGTSVKYDHTAEPADYEIDYFDAQAGNLAKVTYKYPDKTKCLYKDGLNTKLAKIITQKYIANTPWLPLENWSDHRRTGLPFWEIPVASAVNPLSNLEDWTYDTYKNGQRPGLYAQRMIYPNKFKNANPEEYAHALELMGIPSNDDKPTYPLWWAIQK